MRRPGRRAGVAGERRASWTVRYVLDASVAVKWVLDERERDAAVRLTHMMEDGEVHALAPDLLRVEFAGAIQRSEGGDAAFVEVQLRRIEDVAITYHPVSADLMVRAVRLAGEHRLMAADAVYAALAEREGCTVLTADMEMARRLKSAGLATPLSALR